MKWFLLFGLCVAFQEAVGQDRPTRPIQCSNANYRMDQFITDFTRLSDRIGSIQTSRRSSAENLLNFFKTNTRAVGLETMKRYQKKIVAINLAQAKPEDKKTKIDALEKELEKALNGYKTIGKNYKDRVDSFTNSTEIEYGIADIQQQLQKKGTEQMADAIQLTTLLPTLCNDLNTEYAAFERASIALDTKIRGTK